MAAFVLSAEYFPDVRAAIGPEASEAAVPDSTLQLPIFKGEAERYIMRNLTEAQYSDPLYADEATTAAILYLASVVALTLRVVDSETLAGGGRLQYAKFDSAKLSADLLARSQARIADIVLKTTAQPMTMPDNPNFFAITTRRYPDDDEFSGAPENPFVPL